MRKRRLTVLLISISMLVSSCATTEEDNITESTGIATEETVLEVTTDINSSESSEETTASETSEEVILVETALPSQYAEILDTVYEFVVNHGDEFDPYQYDENIIGTGIVETVMPMDHETALESICYSILDIDGNGVDELLIMDNSYGSYRILALYTIDNGNALRVIDGWVRSSYYLLQDKTILHTGSGGAAYNLWGYYEYNDGLLDVIELYYTSDYINGEQDVENIYVYKCNSDSFDFSNPSPSDELLGALQDFVYPETEGHYEFDDITLLADYN